MKTFDNCNPIVLFVYFASVSGAAMFSMNPVILTLSLSGAVMFFLIRNGTDFMKSHIVFLLMFIGMALVNPLFYHNGVTVLFVINNNPITLEALIYGAAASMMIISVLYWFRSFSQIMTSDKLLYLFGAVSPKFALIFSMALRYIPLFGSQTAKVNQVQKALGLYKEDNFIDAVRGGMRIFSVMVTWALENGIITADSMTARGYGTGRRTFFALYRFRKSDFAMMSITLIMFAFTLIGMGTGALEFQYYPAIRYSDFSLLTVITYSSYAFLVFLPSVTELAEEIKWKYLQSRI